MAVQMPGDVAADPALRSVWESVVQAGSGFSEQDVPALRLLCFWHAVAAEAQAQMSEGGGLALFDPVSVKPFPGDDGEPALMVRKAPALSVLKEASAEIRLLSDALGVTPSARSRIGADARPEPDSPNARLLKLVFADRAEKERRAAGS